MVTRAGLCTLRGCLSSARLTAWGTVWPYRAMRLLMMLALAAFLCPPGALAQGTAPAAAPPPAATLTPAQAQAVLNVLKDDKARTQFTAVLEDMARAVPAAAAHAGPSLAADSVGADLLLQGSRWATDLSGQLTGMAQAVGDVPLLWRWLAGQVQEPRSQARVLDLAWKLALVVAGARGVEWLARRLLAPARTLLAASAPAGEPLADAAEADAPGRRHGFNVAWRLLRRLPFILVGFLLDLAPVAVFAVAGRLLLATPLGAAANGRLVVLAVVNAYVICRAVMCVTRMVVSPRKPRLRLVQCSDRWAAYIERWMRRLSVVAVFGFAAGEIGLLLGLYHSAYDVAMKLVGLAVHAMLVVMVLQSRQAVARRLRAPHARSGALASLQNGFASRWHLIAIFYIVAIWLVAAAEIQDGYERLLHFFIVTSATLLVARLASIILLGALDRVAHADADGSLRSPGLEQRLATYYPMLRSLLIGVISAATAVALLEIWGYHPLRWFSGGQLGERLLSALGTSGVAVLLAVVAWETANAAVESKVAAFTRSAQMARAARLRTLLPILRTTLLVTILVITGLIVLSQIGVNIAPLLAGAGVLGVAIGFGSQKLVQDLITGLFLLLENTMQVGDVVVLGGLSGTVETLSIRTIRLRALDGSVHIIPFSSVTTVTNQTRDFSYALVDLPIGLNEEPDHIADLLRGVAKDMRAEPRWRDAITADLEVMGVYAFSDSTWTMRVRIRTEASQRWTVNREFNRRVKYCFDKNAVQSPFTAVRAQELPIQQQPTRPQPMQEAAQ